MDPQLQSISLERLNDELSRYDPTEFKGQRSFPRAHDPPQVLGEQYRVAPAPRALRVDRVDRRKTPPFRYRVHRSWVDFTPVTYEDKPLPQVIEMDPGDGFYVEIKIAWGISQTSYVITTPRGFRRVPVWYKTGAYHILSAKLIKMPPGRPVPVHQDFGAITVDPPLSSGVSTYNYACGDVSPNGAFDVSNGLASALFFISGNLFLHATALG